MALALFDRVQETTTTTGTGSVTLGGAVPGFQSFAVVGNGNTCYYTIVDGSAWEVGVGTYSTSGPTLARTTILSNSNGNTTAITLAAGTKSVFLTYPASKSVNLNESGNVSPLGTVSSGVWQGSTVGVAYGGTGVTASSGANSVVLRDSNQNITVNRINQGIQTITASGGTTVLTAASSYIHTLVGTGGQTYTLPDATTLTTGVAFVFNNLATGTLTLANFAGTTIGTIPSGGAGAVFLTLNSTTGGTWDLHAYLPEGVTFGTNAFNLGTSIITGGTWQGGTIGTAYGGTGLTSYTSGGAVYANSSSTLTSGTLPVTAGGTGATTASGARTSLDVPSTTGSGASGTWGISVTGNSATATLLKAINVTSTSISNWNPGGLTYQAWGQGFTNSAISGDSGDITLWLRPSVYTGGGTELNMYIDGDYYSGTGAFRVLNAGNFNTYAPTLTGSGATGTWNINISGNANNITQYTVNQNLGTGNQVTFDSVVTTNNGNGTNIRLGDDAWIGDCNLANTFRIRGVGDAGQGYIVFGSDLTQLGRSGTGALAWGGNALLTAGNYNSYAPTLTGGGASGTWGINISGNAATATSATDSTKLPLAGGTMTGNILFANSGTTKRGIQGLSGDNDYWFIGGGATATNAGFMEIATGDDAQGSGTSEPIYVSQYGPGDPLSGTLVRRGSLLDANGNTSFPGTITTAGSLVNGQGYFRKDQTAGSYTTAALWTESYGNTTTGIAFHISGVVGRFLEMRTNGLLYWNGTMVADSDFRAPIFYDSDDTSYYVNPNSGSLLSTLTVNNYFSVNTARAAAANGYAANFISSQSAASNYVPFNFASSFGDHSWGVVGRFRIDASGQDRPSIQFSSGSSETRWNVGYCYFDDNFRITQNMGIRNDGGNDGWGTERFRIGTGGDTYIFTNVQSPIFYDLNNTGFYVDPNGLSSLSSISVSTINSRGTGNLMYYQGFTLDANTMETNATGFTYAVNAPAVGPVARFSTGGGYDLWLNAAYSGGNHLYFRTRNGDAASINAWRIVPSYGINYGDSLFATIFYDSNDTAYYVDPNSTGTSFRGRGQMFIGPNSSGRYTRFGGDGGATDEATLSASNGNLHIDCKGGYATYINYYTTNNVYSYGNLGLGSDVASYRLHVHGTGFARDDFRAPIFYDSNDTGYYVDPNGSSRLSTMTVGNGAYCDIILTDDESPSGRKYIHANGNNIGFLSGGGSWIFRVDNNSIAITDGSFRAPIFYDLNDTGYYCDPNGTSNFVGLTVANVISGSVSGRSMYVAPYAVGSSSAYTGRSAPYGGAYTYVGYSDPNTPTTYTAAVGFGNGSGGSGEIIVNWVDGTASGLWFRTLRDCCSNWTGWTRIANYYYAAFGTDITSTGNITAYSSDRRLKTNITPIESPLEKLEKIGGYTFDWDVEKCESLNFKPSNVHEHGVIAQEIQAIMPDAVTRAPFDLDENGNPISDQEYLTVRYDRIVPLLIEAVKEQSKQIKNLQRDLVELRGGAACD